MNEEYLEQECDEPENWESNIILERDGRGDVVEADVPDDVEGVTEDAEND